MDKRKILLAFSAALIGGLLPSNIHAEDGFSQLNDEIIDTNQTQEETLNTPSTKEEKKETDTPASEEETKDDQEEITTEEVVKDELGSNIDSELDIETILDKVIKGEQLNEEENNFFNQTLENGQLSTEQQTKLDAFMQNVNTLEEPEKEGGITVNVSEDIFDLRYYSYDPENKGQQNIYDGMTIPVEALSLQGDYYVLTLYQTDIDKIDDFQVIYDKYVPKLPQGSYYHLYFDDADVENGVTIEISGEEVPSDVGVVFNSNGRYIGNDLKKTSYKAGLTELTTLSNHMDEQLLAFINPTMPEGVILKGWELTKGGIGNYTVGDVLSVEDLTELMDTSIHCIDLQFKAVWEDTRTSYTIAYHLGEGIQLLKTSDRRNYEILTEDEINELKTYHDNMEIYLYAEGLNQEMIHVTVDGKPNVDITLQVPDEDGELVPVVQSIVNIVPVQGTLDGENIFAYKIFMNNINGNVDIHAEREKNEYQVIHHWLNDEGEEVHQETYDAAVYGTKIKIAPTLTWSSDAYPHWVIQKVSKSGSFAEGEPLNQQGTAHLTTPLVYTEDLTLHIYYTQLHEVAFYNAYEGEILGSFGGHSADRHSIGEQAPVYPQAATFADIMTMLDEKASGWRNIQMKNGYEFIGWRIVEIPENTVINPKGGFYKAGDIVQFEDIEAMGAISGQTYFEIAAKEKSDPYIPSKPDPKPDPKPEVEIPEEETPEIGGEEELPTEEVIEEETTPEVLDPTPDTGTASILPWLIVFIASAWVIIKEWLAGRKA